MNALPKKYWRYRRSAGLTRRQFTKSALAASISTLLARPSSSHNPRGHASSVAPFVNPIAVLIAAGGNASFVYENFRRQKNCIRESAGFLSGFASVNLTAAGWPAKDFTCTLWEGTYFPAWATSSAGTPFKCGFIDSSASTSTAVITPSGGGTYANLVHGSPGNYTTFDFYTSSGVGSFGFTITNTGNGANTGAIDIFAYMPAFPGSAIDNPTNSNAYLPSATSFYSKFNSIKNEVGSKNWENTQVASAATRHTAANCQTAAGWNNVPVPILNTAPASSATSAVLASWFWGPGSFWITFTNGTTIYETHLCTITTTDNPGLTVNTWMSNVTVRFPPLVASGLITTIYVGIEGYPLEWDIATAVASNTGLTIGCPINDDGFQGRAGSWYDAAFALVSAARTANPSWTAVVSFSPGNEPWNSGAGLTWKVLNGGAIAYSLPSVYTYLGDLLHAIAVKGRAHFGAAWGTTYQLNAELQNTNCGTFFQCLDYMRTTYWGGSAVGVSNDVQWGLTSNYGGGFGYTPNWTSVATLEASAMAAVPTAAFTNLLENQAIMCMHYGLSIGLYEANLTPAGTITPNAAIFNAMLDDVAGYQPIVAAFINVLQNSGAQLINWSTAGAAADQPTGNQDGPSLEITTDTSGWAITNSNFNTAYPISRALIAAASTPPTYTRNVIGAPGAGPYTILGGNYADATLGAVTEYLNTSSYDQSHGSSYYSAGQGYRGWLISYCAGGTYTLTINAVGSGSTFIEYGSPVNGFTRAYGGVAQALVAGANLFTITLPKGPCYIELGNNTQQSACGISSMTFN